MQSIASLTQFSFCACEKITNLELPNLTKHEMGYFTAIPNLQTLTINIEYQQPVVEELKADGYNINKISVLENNLIKIYVSRA